MRDADCVAFLHWALPRLGFRWPGYRRVRRQVCKRIARRMAVLGIERVGAYRSRLEGDGEEWRALDALCRITLSRFYRDRALWERLAAAVLPALARRRAGAPVRCWSAGCASGEEPYTVSILCRLGVTGDAPARDGNVAGTPLLVLATDADPTMIERARRGCYARATLRETPAGWLERAFERRGDRYCVRSRFRDDVRFREHDLRAPPPRETFDVVLCRNLAFTYFDEAGQAAVLARLLDRIAPHGCLVVGRGEQVPSRAGLVEDPDCPEVLHRSPASPAR